MKIQLVRRLVLHFQWNLWRCRLAIYFVSNYGCCCRCAGVEYVIPLHICHPVSWHCNFLHSAAFSAAADAAAVRKLVNMRTYACRIATNNHVANPNTLSYSRSYCAVHGDKRPCTVPGHGKRARAKAHGPTESACFTTPFVRSSCSLRRGQLQH